MKGFSFKLDKNDSSTKARTSVFSTPHGKINMPVFMPVGTSGSVKTMSPDELLDMQTEIILANTYHLYLRPGQSVIKKFGSLHSWMNWKKPILTDSGGFQVFSLAQDKKKEIKSRKKLVKIKENGVEFRSLIDGSKHFFSPKKVMKIQYDLGADIVMAFDECPPANSSRAYIKESMKRTHRWVIECMEENKKLNKKRKNKQALFPIIQGGTHKDLRIESTKFMADLDLPGIAIGGLSVGEKKHKMYSILETILPYLPVNKPRYLMGVGSPDDLLEAVSRGIDMFDCVMATRNARHGSFWTQNGRFHIKNSKYKMNTDPLMKKCQCYSCKNFTKSYIHHLFAEKEMFGLRLLTIHNVHFLMDLMSQVRENIQKGTFKSFKEKFICKFTTQSEK